MAEHSFKTCDFDGCREPVAGSFEIKVDGAVINARIDACELHLRAVAELVKVGDSGVSWLTEMAIGVLDRVRQVFDKAATALSRS